MSMSLKNEISSDLSKALKGGNGEVVSALRFLLSVIKNNELLKRTKLSKENKPAEELEKLSELSDEETVSVVLSEIKKRKESVAQYEAGGRSDLAGKETKELEIIKKYAPEEMGEVELRAVVKKKISEMGATTKEFGKIMGSVMTEVKGLPAGRHGRAGGDMVKKIIEEELSKN